MDDIRIEALVAREWNDSAQALLVLISVDVAGWQGWPEDAREIWVGVDMPVPLQWDGNTVEWEDGQSHGDAFAAARRLLGVEEDGFQGWLRPDGTALALPRNAGRSHWLARFDFSVHRELERRWQGLRAGAPISPITVSAWRAQGVREPADTQDQATPAKPLTFKPCGNPCSQAFTAREVVRQPLFELGVLFVHGIGNHAVRETLLKFGEPLIEFLMKLLRGVSAAGASALSDDQRAAFKARVQQRHLRRVEDFDGLLRDLERWASPKAGGNPSTAPRDAQEAQEAQLGELKIALLRHEQTLFEQPGEMEFSAALFRLTRVHADHGLRDSHVLLGEAHWVHQAVRPNLGELARWLKRAIPRALELHYAAIGSIPRLLKEAPAPTGLAALAASLEGMLLLPKLLVLAPFHVVAIVLLYWTILLLGVVSVVPIGWLRGAAQTLSVGLLGTIGLSHSLQASPIRRGAIVSRVRQQLDAVRSRCQRVVVVSHSQGAEVMRLVLQRGVHVDLDRWVTLGAGIKPLNLLEYTALNSPRSRQLGQLFGGTSALGALALLGLAMAWIPGLGRLPPALETALIAAGGLTLGAMVLGALYLIAVAIASAGAPASYRNPAEPDFRFRSRKSVMRVLRDYFATHDPVPAGSLVGSWRPEALEEAFGDGARPASIRIDNDRAGWSDHVTYWQNLEQFVAPLGLDLLQLAGLRNDSSDVKAILARADRQRSESAAMRYLARMLTLLLVIGSSAWIAFGTPGHGADWWQAARSAWAQSSGVLDMSGICWRDGLVGTLLRDLALPIGILGVHALWRLWQRARQRHAQSRLIADLAVAVRRADNAPAQ